MAGVRYGVAVDSRRGWITRVANGLRFARLIVPRNALMFKRGMFNAVGRVASRKDGSRKRRKKNAFFCVFRGRARRRARASRARRLRALCARVSRAQNTRRYVRTRMGTSRTTRFLRQCRKWLIYGD